MLGRPLWLKSSCRLRSALVEQCVQTGDLDLFRTCAAPGLGLAPSGARGIIPKNSDEKSSWNVLGFCGPIGLLDCRPIKKTFLSFVFG